MAKPPKRVQRKATQKASQEAKPYMTSSFKKSAKRQRTPVKRKSPGLLKRTLHSRKIKKAKNEKLKRKGYGKAKRAAGTITKVAAIMFIPLLVVYGAYLGVLNVIEIRQGKAASVNGVIVAKERVTGFKEIPIYPGSEFVYKDFVDDESVKRFLSNGESVYRLPPNISFIDVSEYYRKILPSSGWEHVLSVERTSSEQMYGEYWIKSDNESALRIYSKLNDVWYQKLSVEEARTGLAEQVRLENERELIVSSTEGSEFLPHFPWHLKIPNDYLVRYFDTHFENNQGAELNKIGKSEKVFLVPIGRAGTLPPDVMLREFIEEANKNERYLIEKPTGTENRDSDDTEATDTSIQDWEVVSSSYTQVEGRSILLAEISAPGKGGTAYVFENYRSGYVFVLTSFSTDNQMVEYMLKNLTDKKSGYTKEDFDF